MDGTAEKDDSHWDTFKVQNTRTKRLSNEYDDGRSECDCISQETWTVFLSRLKNFFCKHCNKGAWGMDMAWMCGLNKK